MSCLFLSPSFLLGLLSVLSVSGHFSVGVTVMLHPLHHRYHFHHPPTAWRTAGRYNKCRQICIATSACRGIASSHPTLLDWLAPRRQSGWPRTPQTHTHLLLATAGTTWTEGGGGGGGRRGGGGSFLHSFLLPLLAPYGGHQAVSCC